MKKNLYIIGGCNGAGKTTASFTLMPFILECNEFVNADEISRGISPFQPEKVAFEAGLRKVKVFVKGPGSGRESAIRTIHNSGVEVTEIIDITPIPHNGCRPPKRRRI